MRLTALVDGLAVQFAAHDGMMNRDQLIDHVRFAAAAEIGVLAADFTGATRIQVITPPSPATDAALRHLVSSYCDHINRGDATALGKAWIDDGTYHADDKEISGRKRIAAALGEMLGDVDWIVQSAPLMVFEVDEEHGTGTGRITVQERVKRRKVAKPGTTLATYHDQYVRRAGSWFFVSRRVEVIERS
jgi:hypothetical protein